ncbi:MAG: right-handed parallel beta-helix repeat-containing protein [Christensenellales bacterium]
MRKNLKTSALFLLILIMIFSVSGCGEPGNNGSDNTDDFIVPTTLSDKAAASDVYYVSPDGSDDGAGTEEDPFYSLQCALLAVNTFKQTMDCDMKIVLKEGTTYAHETVKITGADNLPNNHTLTIEGEDGAVLSGGRKVTDWEKVTVNGNEIYRARISDEDAVRSFSVNGEIKSLATKYAERNSMNAFSNLKSWSWAEKDLSIRIQDSALDLNGLYNYGQLELGMTCQWKIFIFKTAGIVDNQTVKLLQPYAAWFTTPATVGNLDPGGWWFPNPKYGLWLQNDVSFIDVPGEWCFDKSTKYLYYYPEEGEDMSTAECSAGKLDKLMEIAGGKNEKNVFVQARNVTVKNLEFTLGNFDLLDEQGIGIVQGQEYYCGLTETQGSVGDNSVQPTPSTHYDGNIVVKYASNVNFRDCVFSGFSKPALHYDTGTQNSSIVGCVFFNLGDSAVMVSNPAEISSASNDRVLNIKVSNNLIRNTGNCNYSSAAIDAYYCYNLEISNNDIYNVPNSGISLGWGWYIMDLAHIGSNRILNNRVGLTGHSTNDGGPIYVLGKTRNGEISGNYVYDQRSAFAGLYIDEGSCNWLVDSNLVDNVWYENEHIAWLRLNGFDGGPGGSTTVYLNTVTNNYYSNFAIADCGNTSEEYKNVLSDNRFACPDNFDGNATAKDFYPDCNPDWVDEAKRIFSESGLTESYQGLLNKLK